MAKGKSLKAAWVCEETGLTQGIFEVNKDKFKTLPKRQMYCPSLRKKTSHKAKEMKDH